MTVGRFAARALAGAALGTAATWVMGRATTWMYAREDPDAKEWEEAARGGTTAYETAAEKAAALLGRELDDEQRQDWGQVVHWGLGAAAGAWYATRHHPRGLVRGLTSGLSYGLNFFLIADEAANTVLGFTPPPRAFPWQAHARGLAGHLVYGTVLALGLTAVDAAIGAVGARRARPEAPRTLTSPTMESTSPIGAPP